MNFMKLFSILFMHDLKKLNSMNYDLRVLALRKYDLRSTTMGSQIAMYDPTNG